MLRRCAEALYAVLLDSPRAVVLFGIAAVVLLAPLVVRVARKDRRLIREQDGRVDEDQLTRL